MPLPRISPCPSRKGVRPPPPRSKEEEPPVAKQKPDLPQGTLDLLVLKALSLGPMHGYGVGQRIQQLAEDMLTVEEGTLYPALYRDRKSTRLNSSHANISYAVFCLKKKKIYI